jgi:hypothetical protein
MTKWIAYEPADSDDHSNLDIPHQGCTRCRTAAGIERVLDVPFNQYYLCRSCNNVWHIPGPSTRDFAFIAFVVLWLAYLVALLGICIFSAAANLYYRGWSRDDAIGAGVVIGFVAWMFTAYLSAELYNRTMYASQWTWRYLRGEQL